MKIDFNVFCHWKSYKSSYYEPKHVCKKLKGACAGLNGRVRDALGILYLTAAWKAKAVWVHECFI